MKMIDKNVVTKIMSESIVSCWRCSSAPQSVGCASFLFACRVVTRVASYCENVTSHKNCNQCPKKHKIPIALKFLKNLCKRAKTRKVKHVVLLVITSFFFVMRSCGNFCVPDSERKKHEYETKSCGARKLQMTHYSLTITDHSRSSLCDHDD